MEALPSISTVAIGYIQWGRCILLNDVYAIFRYDVRGVFEDLTRVVLHHLNFHMSQWISDETIFLN